MANQLAAVGFIAIAGALLIMGVLSKRLGQVTKAAAYYRGFYVASVCVMIGALARLIPTGSKLAPPPDLQENILWVLLYNGTPALGVTLGVIFAWRYWSWLLAERS